MAAVIRAGIASVGLLAFLAACLFVPAGRIAWPAGWWFLAAFTAFTAAAYIVLDPELVSERVSPGGESDRGDALLASLGFLGLYPGTLIVAGLDAGRGGAFFTVPVQAIALSVFVLGYGFALWAMRVNRFFSTFVRIQAERGHIVVDTGPYAWVRHPGYAGALVAHLAIPFALGSPWALLPALAGAALFTLRTGREDRVLAERLEGYREYRQRVRWRLLPGVW